MTRTSASRRGAVERYCPSCDRSYPDEIDRCPEDGTRLVQLSDRGELAPGREIDGRFTILETIRSGGMGTVYRAQQISVGREVAIKVIHPRLGGDITAAKRFLREAKLTSRLSHINNVMVLDFGQTADQLLYLVMELLPGRTLANLLEEGPLPVPRAIGIARQICDALEAAHRLEIMHRDLKPSNIMVVEERADRDVIKVLDFGLAKSLSGDTTTVTRSDMLVGTPRYMSPDAVLGHPVDARTDLYSLGVILYEMVSGQLPFRCDNVEALINHHAVEEPQPLDEAIPPAVRRVIGRLIEKHPDDRYRTAADARDALVAADASSPGLPQPIAPLSGAVARFPEDSVASASAVASGVEPARSRRWLWLLVVAILAVGGGVYVMSRPHQGGDSVPATGAPGSVALSGPADGGAGAPRDGEVPPGSVDATDQVGLAFESTPPGATVLLDGVAVGTTPHTEHVARSDQPLTAVFSHDGYQPETREVVPSKSQPVQVELTRRSRTRPASHRERSGGHRATKPDAAPDKPVVPPPESKLPWVE